VPSRVPALAQLSGHRFCAAGLAIACFVAAADTGAQPNTWRQCRADVSSAAIGACTAIIFLDPENDGAFVNRGIAYRRLGDLDSAIRDYNEAIRLNPRAADAFNNRGNAFRAREELSLARRDYDEAIRLNPRYAHAYNNRGIIFLELGNFDRAVADFDRAIREQPGYANAFRNRGLARTHQQLFNLAVQDFDAAFGLDSTMTRGTEYAIALFGRGAARQRDGDAAGLADIDEARRLLPDVAEIMAGSEEH
jgi:tetratricopeptide (TPR) repeat protein